MLRNFIALIAACVLLIGVPAAVGNALTASDMLSSKNMVPNGVADTEKGRVTQLDIDGLNLRQQAEADRLAEGFLKLVRSETRQNWYECGEATPVDQWQARARRMTGSLLASMDEIGLRKVSAWGILAVIWKESRGNRCAVGPNPRKLARAKKLIGDRHYRLWTEEEVLDLMDDPLWKHSLADLGWGQVVWRKYARILGANGKPRVPTAQEMVSHDDGMRVLVYGMYDRMRFNRGSRDTKTRPWLFWPSSVVNYGYEMDIAQIVRAMGGPAEDLYRR